MGKALIKNFREMVAFQTVEKMIHSISTVMAGVDANYKFIARLGGKVQKNKTMHSRIMEGYCY